MIVLWKGLSFAGLLLTAGPSFFVFAGAISWNVHVTLMMAGTVLWFATAPLWMEGSRVKRKRAAANRTDS